MRIAESVLEHNLRNAYWIGGGPCGGKTTIADLIAQRHGWTVFHPENQYAEYRSRSCREDHPWIMTPSCGAEVDFNRPVDERVRQIRGSDREYFEWVLMDVVKLSANGSVVVEGHMLDPGHLHRMVPDNRSVFLFARETVIRDSFYGREITSSLERAIDGLKDPAKTRQHTLEVVVKVSAEKLAEAQAVGVPCLVRDAATTLEQALAAVEEHFGSSAKGEH